MYMHDKRTLLVACLDSNCTDKLVCKRFAGAPYDMRSHLGMYIFWWDSRHTNYIENTRVMGPALLLLPLIIIMIYHE